MARSTRLSSWPLWAACAALLPLALLFRNGDGAAPRPGAAAKGDYAAAVRPALDRYCLSCHSTKAHKGSLDLERFAGEADLRKHLKVWQGVIEQLEAGEMPPKNKPQPS